MAKFETGLPALLATVVCTRRAVWEKSEMAKLEKERGLGRLAGKA